MNFREIADRRRPNQWLIAPPGFSNRAPDATPPVFDAPVETMRARWSEMIARQPRIRILRDEPAGMDLIQRTAVLRFGDDIGVGYVALGHGRSTIALYSRSRIGYSDLGVNRRRLEEWLMDLCGSLPVAIRASVQDLAKE